MIDFVKLQEDATHALLSAELLAQVGCLQFRKLRLQGEVDHATLVLTPRNGRSGACCIVEMPEFRVAKPNLPGPEAEIVVPVLVLEEPNLNFEPTTGTFLSAEEIAQLVLDVLHGLRVNGAVGYALYADTNAITPADEFAGLVAYRVHLKLRQSRKQTNRCQIPAYQFADGIVTLTNGPATPGAKIYVTLDDSFPGPSNIGKGAVEYTDPFEVETGQIIRWAAYLEGFNGSDIGREIVP